MVVVCSIVRYCSKNLFNSCFQFLPSTYDVCISFPKGFILLFPFGHNGVLVVQLMPKSSIHREKSFPLKGGPLCVFNLSGMPSVAKIRSIFSMQAFVSVEFTTSTSGNFVYVYNNNQILSGMWNLSIRIYG